MSSESTRRSLPLLTALTAVALVLPAGAAGGQPPGPTDGYFGSVLRSWTFSGCGRGTVVARPEPVVGDVVCVTGVASWGRVASDDFWRLRLDLQQTFDPAVTVGPFLDGNDSFVSFLYSADGAGCERTCEGTSAGFGFAVSPGDRAGRIVASDSYLGALAAEEGMDPNSLALTGVSLLYLYVPPGGDGMDWGVLLEMTPTVVPEPASLGLMAAGLALIGIALAGRRRKERAATPTEAARWAAR